MSAQHTPGPWTYTVENGGDDFHLKAGEQSIINGCGCCGSPYMAGENYEANARLIAAAPDLLVAAIRARDALATLIELPVADLREHPAYAALDAVITKATGSEA